MENLIELSTTAIAKFSEAKSQIEKLATQCNNVVITNIENLETAKHLAKTAKAIENLIEEKRKEITAPILNEKKKIDDFAKTLTSKLNDALKNIRGQILSFEKRLEEERIAEQRRIEAEKRELEERLKKAALEDTGSAEVLEKESLKLIEMNEQSAKLSNQTSNSVRKVWKYSISDMTLIPRDYLTVDEKKVKDAISSGIREIPGILIFQEDQLVLR
ncbi:hypothetical protein MASR1M45_12270 [Candidatus Kapaibacterium sp.]